MRAGYAVKKRRAAPRGAALFPWQSETLLLLNCSLDYDATELKAQVRKNLARPG